MAAFIGFMFVVFMLGVSYLATAGLVYLVCLGFGLEWSWLLSLGVWALMILLRIFVNLFSKD